MKEENNEIKCKMCGHSKDIETSRLVKDLYYAALECYGKEYEKRLKDTIESIIFYECVENENCIDVVERLSGINSRLQVEYDRESIAGITLELDNQYFSKQPVLIYKKTKHYDCRATIAHELFYHQFCRQSNLHVVGEDGRIYYRDGIAFLTDKRDKRKNEALNEGFADFFATKIMRIYTKDESYSLDNRRFYAIFQKYAEQIASLYEHKDIIKMITTGEPSLQDKFKDNEISFELFSAYLDMYLNEKDYMYIERADKYFEKIREKYLKNQNDFLFER